MALMTTPSFTVCRKFRHTTQHGAIESLLQTQGVKYPLNPLQNELFRRIIWKSKKDLLSLHRPYPRFGANGWDSDILKSVIDALFLTV